MGLLAAQGKEPKGRAADIQKMARTSASSWMMPPGARSAAAQSWFSDIPRHQLGRVAMI